MKALTALFLFLVLTKNSFAQTPVRLDTLLGGKTKFVEERDQLVQRRYRGEHYFFLKTNDPNVLLMLSTKNKPSGRCWIKTPPKCGGCKFFRVICQGIEHNYDIEKHAWGQVGPINAPTLGKHDNHDGP